MIDTIRILERLRVEPRSQVWQSVHETLRTTPEYRPVGRVLSKYIRTLLSYEAFLRRLPGTARGGLPPRQRSRRLDPRPCRGCGRLTSEHGTKEAIRYHFFAIRQRYRIKQRWKGTSFTERRLATDSATSTRRLKFLRSKLPLVAPRILTLLGERKVLELLSDAFPVRSLRPSECKRQLHQSRH